MSHIKHRSVQNSRGDKVALAAVRQAYEFTSSKRARGCSSSAGARAATGSCGMRIRTRACAYIQYEAPAGDFMGSRSRLREARRFVKPLAALSLACRPLLLVDMSYGRPAILRSVIHTGHAHIS